MYGFVWSHTPGPTWFKVFLAIVLILAVVFVCFQYFFPWVAPMLPFNDQVSEQIGDPGVG